MTIQAFTLRAITGLVAFGLVTATALAQSEAPPAKEIDSKAKANPWAEKRFESKGSVTVAGKHIDYSAVSGTLMIEDKKNAPGALMSYTAYFKKGDGPSSQRPITFLYNGGPGSATFWLHMGSFGPKRVVVGDGERGPAAPYRVIENEYSGLDASDLVFIDAPGTGFGRVGQDEKSAESPEKFEQIAKRNEEVKKDFFGVDQDARAFTIFITKFLSRYDRWNSPRFIFGESYGTMRSAVLARMLSQANIDLNGVMLLSQVLNYGSGVDSGRLELGEDTPFVMSLPSYAATAWYHKKLSAAPQNLEDFLAEVRRFALQDYAPALAMGDSLSADAKHAMALKLHDIIGLPADYIEKANLRVNGGMFRKTLRESEGLIVGRLDSRYASPPVDEMAKESDYDPQSAAISSAYVAAYNEYGRDILGFGKDDDFKSTADVYRLWDTRHQPPGAQMALSKTTNVIPDLAATMRINPKLKVMLCSGYYDLATLFFAGEYELNHLGLPPDLRKNVEIRHFPVGHMVYVNEEGLKNLHQAFSQFIASNSH